MKLTDRRMYQAANLEDLAFRFYYREFRRNGLPALLAYRLARLNSLSHG